MLISEVIGLGRFWLDDSVVPYKWTLEEMVAYLNSTINELCEVTKVLVDSTTPEICEIPVVAGTAKYAIDERIIEILLGRLVLADVKVTRRTRTYMDHYCSGWDSALASTGTPKNFLGDLDTGFITLTPTPDADDTLKITAVRYPLQQITSAMIDGKLTAIHFKYHFDLLDGICGRAYLKQDSETYDPKKAERHLGLWRARMDQIMLNIINANDIDNLDDQVPDYLGD